MWRSNLYNANALQKPTFTIPYTLNLLLLSRANLSVLIPLTISSRCLLYVMFCWLIKHSAAHLLIVHSIHKKWRHIFIWFLKKYLVQYMNALHCIRYFCIDFHYFDTKPLTFARLEMLWLVAMMLLSGGLNDVARHSQSLRALHTHLFDIFVGTWYTVHFYRFYSIDGYFYQLLLCRTKNKKSCHYTVYK